MTSSRVFVRGLPSTFTERDARAHFSTFPVTDVKVFPHRRIGYVGYKTSEDATAAVKYFNKSFIKLTKIYAELARPITDQDLPKSRQQQKLEKSNTLRTHDHVQERAENDKKRKREDVEKDPKLMEFLDVYQAPSRTNVWENRDAHFDATISIADISPDTVGCQEDKSDGEYQIISKKTKTHRQALPPEEVPALTENSTAQVQGHDEHTDEASKDTRDEAVSDVDWLRSRTKRALDLVEDDEILVEKISLNVPSLQRPSPPPLLEETERTSNGAENTQNVEPEAEEVVKIRENGRLFLRNLHYEVTDDELRKHFSKYASLQNVHVPQQKTDGKGKGFAFLYFSDPGEAVEAYLNNDNTIFQGRLLHIISAKPKRDDKLDDFQVSKLPLKKQKEIRQRQESRKFTFSWNSLYLNADAVVSAVADRMGISKAELLDPTSSNAAVKQAHAETHIVQEIKSYFIEHGVDLEAFRKSTKGDLAILVKNVPRGTTQNELRDVFEAHGRVSRFLMPPTGMTAIVEFSNAVEARAAFTALSYRKLKDSILYLERAPKDLFKSNVPADNLQSASQTNAKAKVSVTDLLEENMEEASTNTATLYVRNLNFTTTTERLSEAFRPLTGFRSAMVKTKADPRRGLLSMGFGFVEFNSPATAQLALQTMDGFDLEGHRLHVRSSHKGTDAAEERRKEDVAKKAGSTKILIKNLPFEATKQDVRALFTPYGQLRSVRVPKRFDLSSRGFAFADFTTKRDALNAMNSLKNTHLLGRHLVLEFATAESDDPEAELEKMQKKVGAQANKVALQHLMAGGRRKLDATGAEAAYE